MDDTKLTQNESKFVVEWLRSTKKVNVENKLSFWRQRPTGVVDQIRRDWKVDITPQEIIIAARREQ